MSVVAEAFVSLQRAQCERRSLIGVQGLTVVAGSEGSASIPRVRLGLHASGIGFGARRAVIDAVAVAADERRFATLWAGEHVVMVDRS